MRLDGKPALVFAAHLANWELPAYVAAAYKLDLNILYRRPNIAAIDEAVRQSRAGIMGTLIATGLDAPVKLARVLEHGGHVAMLVDQHYVRGVDVTFFGRTCKANPLLARLAQHVDCPIHGARIVRLPDRDRFRVDLTEAIAPARDADGRVDVAGHDADRHLGGRRLGARASRAMAVAAPPLAVGISSALEAIPTPPLMPALVAGIHVFMTRHAQTWMPGLRRA